MKHNPGFLKLVDAARTRVKECTVAQAKARLDRGEVPHFLDVREDHEFAKDHAKGARHLGKGVIERDAETCIPNKDEVVLSNAFRYCVCVTSDRSALTPCFFNTETFQLLSGLL